MKNLKLTLLALTTVFALTFFACKKQEAVPDVTSDAKPVANPTNCSLYGVTLAKAYASGQTTFTWTITNPKPGNGSGTTLQDLSHWDFVASACLDQNWQDVLSAAYSTDNGVTWVPISNINIEPDPSLKTCMGNDVFKYDVGTSGSKPTKYKMILLGNWGTGNLDVYFKSGANTGCCAKTFADLGIGCRVDESCSFSQGYWFANNGAHPNGVHPWWIDPNDHTQGLKTVAIGGKIYTNAEGLAIWSTSNAGGIKDSKKAFTQLASILLSDVNDPALSSSIATINNWLATKSKLGPANLPNQTAAEILSFGDAKAAAGVISAWINANHCQ